MRYLSIPIRPERQEAQLAQPFLTPPASSAYSFICGSNDESMSPGGFLGLARPG